LIYDGINLSGATRGFHEIDAKYKMHVLLREISHPLNATNCHYPVNPDVPPIETNILQMPHRGF